MIERLYVGDAFGWECEETAKVAISQLRQSTVMRVSCPKAQLIKNESIRCQTNFLKFIGYIPVLNIVAGAIAISTASSHLGCRPDNKNMWIGRGVAMILTGPLLAIVDAIKYIYDMKFASNYGIENPELIRQFDTAHAHSEAYWPGHPVHCLGANGSIEAFN